MIVNIKDAAKLAALAVIACCAVLVCTMFLNFYLDITQIEDMLSSAEMTVYYTAQVLTAKVVCCVTGGCLLLCAVIMLLFYVKHYTDTHKKELGILKALGYSELKAAAGFSVFGISPLIGAAAGFGGAFLLMPAFYEMQNKDHILPEITISFHPSLMLCFVVLPTSAFAALAVFYAFLKLKKPVLTLIKEISASDSSKKKYTKDKNSSFLKSLRSNTLKTKKTLVFFTVFASFCFSAMTQMSASMKELSSPMMGAMMLIIGLVLAFTTLFISVSSVVNGNKKTVAMMRAFGYSEKECSRCVLGCYRPTAYIGFAIGTVYQYALLRIMVDIVFRDFGSVPEYSFDFPVMLACLALFAVMYESVMLYCTKKLRKISIKEIMVD